MALPYMVSHLSFFVFSFVFQTRSAWRYQLYTFFPYPKPKAPPSQITILLTYSFKPMFLTVTGQAWRNGFWKFGVYVAFGLGVADLCSRYGKLWVAFVPSSVHFTTKFNAWVNHRSRPPTVNMWVNHRSRPPTVELKRVWNYDFLVKPMFCTFKPRCRFPRFDL